MNGTGQDDDVGGTAKPYICSGVGFLVIVWRAFHAATEERGGSIKDDGASCRGSSDFDRSFRIGRVLRLLKVAAQQWHLQLLL